MRVPLAKTDISQELFMPPTQIRNQIKGNRAVFQTPAKLKSFNFHVDFLKYSIGFWQL